MKYVKKILKKAILTAYELCPDVYRRRFGSSRKFSNETYADSAFKLTQAFKRWLNGVKTCEDVERLRETFLMEQFMESMGTDLKLWLTDRDPKSLDEMARLYPISSLRCEKLFHQWNSFKRVMKTCWLVHVQLRKQLDYGIRS